MPLTLSRLRTCLLALLWPAAHALAQDTCPSDTQAFSVVVLPDTQFYTERQALAPAAEPDTYEKTAKWIVAHRDQYRIKFVIHLGDVTNRYEKTTDSEWKVARAAHDLLKDADIPFSVIPGNHDYDKRDDGDDDRDLIRHSLGLFHKYFGPENSVHKFEVGDSKFMVLGLEMTPRKDTMCWASDQLAANPDRWAIVSTHCYLGHDSTNKTAAVYQDNCDSKYQITGAPGRVLWNELIGRHPNVMLALAGHINGSARATRRRACWAPVHEMLTDYQQEKFGHYERVHDQHGRGWFRILKFYPAEQRVRTCVKTVLPDVVDFEQSDDYESSPLSNSHDYFLAPVDVHTPLPGQGQFARMEFFSDRTVNTDDTGEQTRPSVATNAAGDWVAAWAENPQGLTGDYRLKARLFATDGCARKDIGEFTVAAGPLAKEVPPEVLLQAGAIFNQSPPQIIEWLLAQASSVVAPSVAMSSSEFAIVWAEDADRDGRAQIMLRMRSLGAGANFTREVSAPERAKGSPRVAMDGSGGVVVVWHDEGSKINGLNQVYARGYNRDGTSRFGPTVVNTDSAGDQRYPAVAIAPDGDFVVVWQDDSNGNRVYQIAARGFKRDGSPRFPQRTINTVDAGQQLRPAVAMDAGKRFVVTWQDDRDGNDVYQIMMRGFSASGTQRFSERTVNTTSDGQQIAPQISMSAQGNFTVAWADDRNTNGVYQIRSRRYDAGGAARTDADETVNRIAVGQQTAPAIAMNAMKFVVAWRDDIEKNGRGEILAKGCLNTLGCSVAAEQKETEVLTETIAGYCAVPRR